LFCHQKNGLCHWIAWILGTASNCCCTADVYRAQLVRLYTWFFLLHRWDLVENVDKFQSGTDGHKLTIVEVVTTSSPLYKLTFFPTDCQTNLLQICIITVIEETAWEFYYSMITSRKPLIIFERKDCLCSLDWNLYIICFSIWRVIILHLSSFKMLIKLYIKAAIRILPWLILKNIWKNDECIMENNFSRSIRWSKIVGDFSVCIVKKYCLSENKTKCKNFVELHTNLQYIQAYTILNLSIARLIFELLILS